MSKRRHRDFAEADDAADKYDVGLGPTLAYLRGETDEKATGVDDEDGWTKVESHGRRRKRPDRRHSSTRRQNPLSERKPSLTERRSSVDENYVPFDDGHERCENPFAAKDEKTGKSEMVPSNPFSTLKSISYGLDTATATAAAATSTKTAREEDSEKRRKERNYPSIEYSPTARIQSFVKIADLQSLVLYLLADGPAPQWVAVNNRTSIRQVVTLMVPGLETDMFTGDLALDDDDTHAHRPKRLRIKANDEYPVRLSPDRLHPSLRPLAALFTHVWPVRAHCDQRGGDYFQVHSPMHALLTSQLLRSRDEKKLRKGANRKGPWPQGASHWTNHRTPVTEYLAGLEELRENEYVVHPAWVSGEAKVTARKRREAAKQTLEYGWVDTSAAQLEDGIVPEEEVEHGSVTAGRHILAIDCEMCKDEKDEHVLTRISVVDWDSDVVMDKLVKPNTPIKDYLTQWSGITASMLEEVTTTLTDIQRELLQLITPRTILVGHSLNSDLNALKLTHPFIIDTSILFPHPRGPPFKQALKFLAQKYLDKNIQKGVQGHDSTEDARTCLELVKQKCERGPRWGTSDTNAESIFKRLGRTTRPRTTDCYRAGAVIDWGFPNRGPGSRAQVCVDCQSDDEVVEAIGRAVNGQAVGKQGTTEKVDFIWARLRELELARGWWDSAGTSDDVETIRQSALKRLGLSSETTDQEEVEISKERLGRAVAATMHDVGRIYNALPRCTALIVYSGLGDPREMRRLQRMQQQHRRDYATENWDRLTVQWSETEVKALSKACQRARNGLGFITVK